jgi:hypothetical protein
MNLGNLAKLDPTKDYFIETIKDNSAYDDPISEKDYNDYIKETDRFFNAPHPNLKEVYYKEDISSSSSHGHHEIKRDKVVVYSKDKKPKIKSKKTIASYIPSPMTVALGLGQAVDTIIPSKNTIIKTKDMIINSLKYFIPSTETKKKVSKKISSLKKTISRSIKKLSSKSIKKKKKIKKINQIR